MTCSSRLLGFAQAGLVTMMSGLGIIAGACVHYEAKPIAPTQSLATIEQHTTDDNGLRNFLAANGATVPDPPHWGLRALTLVAFYYHPDLDEARAAWAVARGGVVTAGARPNPDAQPTIGYASTPPPWMPGFGLLWPIETAGKRGYRIAEAQRRADAAQLRIIATAWQVRVAVRQSALDLINARRAESILTRQSALQDDIVQLLERQFQAGAVTPFEVAQARLAAATTRLAVNQATIQRAQAEAVLADALGLSRAAFQPISGFVDVGADLNAPVPELDARRQALISRADVRAALVDYEASQSALQLEIARQYPDVQLGLGYLLDQGVSKFTVTPTVALPVLNRNQGPIAEAAARREQAAAHLMVVQADALRELSIADGTLQAARQKLATAELGLTTAQQQEQRRQRMYEAGDISRVEVLTAQLETISAEVAAVDARNQVERAAGAFEDAMQAPLGFESAVLTNPRTPVTPQREKR